MLRAAPDRVALRQAADWAATVADSATSALAFEDAARYLATALDAAEAADPTDADRARLLIQLATAEYRAGQFGASLQHAVAAADAAERDRRPDLLAEAALVVRGVGHQTVAATLLGLCDPALDPGCPARLRARLLAQRASALAELGDLVAADADSASAMAAATGDRTRFLGAPSQPRLSTGRPRLAHAAGVIPGWKGVLGWRALRCHWMALDRFRGRE